MARVFAARQIKDGPHASRWRFTVASDEESWPAQAVGACAEDGACPDGHATEAEAVEHYRRGSLRPPTTYEEPDHQRRCAGCGTWTTGFVEPNDEMGFCSRKPYCIKCPRDEDVLYRLLFPPAAPG